MGNFKRCTVVFNLDNPTHLELYSWCMRRTTNFSDFVRALLFTYKQMQTAVGSGEGVQKSASEKDNLEAMSDLL